VHDARAWRVVAGCFVCLVAEAVGTYVFTPLLKPVVEELGWSRTEFTLSGLWLSLAMMGAVPLAGMLADRGWATVVLAVGALSLGLAMWLFAGMQSLGEFYATTAIMGVGVGCVGGIPTTALVSRWVETWRGRAIGIVGLGHNVGGLLVPPFVTAIALASGWRTAFRDLAGVLWLVALPAILLLVRDAPFSSDARMDTTASGERIAFRDGVRSTTFWRLSTAMFLHIFYFSGVTVHFVAFTTDLGFDPERAAVAFGALLGIGLVGRLLFGWAADRLDRRSVMVGGLVVTAVAALCLQRITAPGALPLFVVLHGISVAGVQTLFALLVADCFGAINVGTFLGATMLFQVPGGVAGAILAAASFDRLGSYTPAYALFAAGNVVAALAIARVRPYARKPAPHRSAAPVPP